MGRARQGRPLEASRWLLPAWGLALAPLVPSASAASPCFNIDAVYRDAAPLVPSASAASPCFNIDAVYRDARNTTKRYPNGGFVASAKACQQACKARGPFCKYFSWMRNPDPSKRMGMGACWVHEDVGPLLDKVTTISGPQNCDPGDAGGLADVSDALAAGAFPGEVGSTVTEAPGAAAVTTAAPAAGGPPAAVLPGTSEPAAPTLPPIPTLPAIAAPTALPNPPAVPALPGILPVSPPSSPTVAPESSTTPPASAGPVIGTRKPAAAGSFHDVTPAYRNNTNGTDLAGTVEEGGFPWWGYFLIALGVAACGGIILLLACAGGKKAKKKKRKRSAEPESDEDTHSREVSIEAAPMLNGQPPAGQGPDLFDLIDRDHDGKITNEEFMAAMGAQAQAAPVATVQMRQVPVMVPQQTVVARPPMTPPTPAVLVTQRPAPAPGAQSPDLFDMIDRNHDGRITGAEWAAAMGTQVPQAKAAAPPPPPPPQPRPPVAQPGQRPDLFDLIDRNHDGRITGAEFAAAMGTQVPQAKAPAPQPPPPRPQPQRPPAAQPGQRPDLFDLIDRNHDGRITGAEFAAAMGTQVPQPQRPPAAQPAMAHPPGAMGQPMVRR